VLASFTVSNVSHAILKKQKDPKSLKKKKKKNIQLLKFDYVMFFPLLQGNLQIHQVHVGQDGQVNVGSLFHLLVRVRVTVSFCVLSRSLVCSENIMFGTVCTSCFSAQFHHIKEAL